MLQDGVAMEALDSLLLSAASGDTAAYDRIVSRFRDMALQEFPALACPQLSFGLAAA
jgi:hypothetical protein